MPHRLPQRPAQDIIIIKFETVIVGLCFAPLGWHYFLTHYTEPIYNSTISDYMYLSILEWDPPVSI